MKKILGVLLLTLLVGAVQAAQPENLSRREKMLLRYGPKPTVAVKASAADTFLRAVRQGDLEAIAQVTDKETLTAQDKFGNNAFHLAPNAATIQAVAGQVRRMLGEEEDFVAMLSTLRNQRNWVGETPLMTHINYGDADTFQLLYEGSSLAEKVRAARLVNKGGALEPTAWVLKQVARVQSTDNSGRTVAQAALAHYQSGNLAMQSVVEFFQKNASYLF